MVDLKSIRERTISVDEYIQSLDDKNRDIVMEMYEQYDLDGNIVKKLRNRMKDITTVAFSAAWCGDCKNAMPVIKHLVEQIGIEVRIFDKIKTAPLDPDHQWKIPPSPPEIEEWNVTAIPWFEFIDENGRRIAHLIEKPKIKDTLEAEMLYVLKNK
jgi:thiol-disulfide isomerase/thioredoxin